MQLYVPPDTMMNKDFLKQVFAEKKKLMTLVEVMFINVPYFDELSIKALWPDMKNNEQFMLFFPDELPKGRLPDRDYFFNILNTLQGEYLRALIDHANKMRKSVNN